MQALRLNEVLMRVVAWHNRHPLASRVTATQVHSIGEVVLPFAGAQAGPLAWPAQPLAPAGPPALPAVAELLDPPAAPEHDPPAAWLPVDDAASAQPDPPGPATQAPDLAPADAARPDQTGLPLAPEATAPDTETAAEPDESPEMVVEFSQDPFEAAEQDGAAEADPDPGPNLDPDADSLALAGHAAGLGADVGPAVPASVDNPGDAPPQAATAPAAPAALHAPAVAATARTAADTAPALARWVQALRKRLGLGQPALPRLRALFSRDFIWPLHPRQVARWARRHGALQTLAPADWPRRVVDTDPQLQAAAYRQRLPHTVPLHLLTAAIGVGDRRIRVLIAADGAVIGPRAYNRQRVASAGLLLLLALAGLGWNQQRNSAQALAQAQAALVATAAAQADVVQAAVAQAAVAAAQAASAPEAASAPATEDPVARLAGPAAVDSATPAHSAAAEPPASVALADQVPPAASAPAEDTVNPAAGTALGDIRPRLSDDQKAAARAQAAALRAASAASAAAEAPTGPEPTYALVSRPTRERYAAVSHLALMRASSRRLPPPLPEHNELMQDQGEWRAAWWPFANLADAERARVMLAGRGLKVEVVEF